MQRKIHIAVGFVFILASCASSSGSYLPPQEASSATTERNLQIPFEQAWDSYVAELSKSFFVITISAKSPE